jgi:very-short-patch-repair endonuclease
MSEVTVIKNETSTYFSAIDVFKNLGLTWQNYNNSLKRRGIYRDQVRYGDSLLTFDSPYKKANDAIYISAEAFEHLCQTSNKAKLKDISNLTDSYGLNLKTTTISLHNFCVDTICCLLNNNEHYQYKTLTEHSLGKYRVDIFLPDEKICIEVDQNNHVGYDKEKEKERTDFITKSGFELIRVNLNEWDHFLKKLIKSLSFDGDFPNDLIDK